VSYRGIQIRDAGDRIYFVVPFKDSSGDPVVASGGLLYLAKLTNTSAGSVTYSTYDFNSNTFKTTAIATPNLTAALTHQKINNATVDTGDHNFMLETVTGFAVGDMIRVWAYHPNSSPQFLEDIFQYGQVGNALG
jgi:hypothetical protein